MRDTVLTAKQKTRELAIFTFCIVASFVVNIYSIISYKTKWTELYSQWFTMLMVSLLLYAFSWLLRGMYFLFLWLLKKKTINN